MKKLIVLFFGFMFLFQSFGYSVDDYDITQPAGTSNASDIDANVIENQTAILRLLLNYKRGLGLNYSTASALTVLTGEVACPNSGGTVARLRRLTTNSSVGWADIDTGAEAASTTYYVYALGDTDATTPTFSISTSSTAPSGKTYYLKIGQFKNDSSSNITDVVSYQSDDGTDHAKVAKAWINFNSTTAAINDQFNVTSITDNGVGDFTVTWETDFSSANYCPVGSGLEMLTNTGLVVNVKLGTTLAVGSATFTIKRSDTAVNIDSDIVNIVVFGDRV